MNTVILMVNRSNEPVYDVEVPADVPLEILADALAQAFQWTGAYNLQSSNGTNLSGQKTLAELGLWDGIQLMAVPAQRPVSQTISAAPTMPSNVAKTPALQPQPLPKPTPPLNKPQIETPNKPVDKPVNAPVVTPATPAIRGMRSLQMPQPAQNPAESLAPPPNTPTPASEPSPPSEVPESPVKGWRKTPPKHSSQNQ